MKNSIAIIIPNYNSAETTKKLLKALKNQGDFFDIVVVDDQSTDMSFSELRMVDNIILLKNKKNMGCGSALNTGIDYCLDSGYEYLILTDNDAMPKSKNLVRKLIEQIQKKSNYGFIVPKNIDKNTNQGGEICGWMFHFFTISTKLIKKIGKIDPNYFIQIEDLDYSRRICMKNLRGFQIYETYSHPDKPSTWVSPNFIYYTIRNSLYFNKKFNKGIRKIIEERKIMIKCGVISAFSKINNLNLEIPVSAAISDYKSGNMGKNLKKFDKDYINMEEKFINPRSLYLRNYPSNRIKYVLMVAKYLIK